MSNRKKKEICWPLVVNIFLIVLFTAMTIATIYYVVVYGVMGKGRETVPTVTSIPTATLAPTTAPTATLAPTAEPTEIPSPTVEPTVTLVPTEIPSPTETVEPTLEPVETIVPTATSTPVPTSTPVLTPTNTPTPVLNADGSIPVLNLGDGTIQVGEYVLPESHVGTNGTVYPTFLDSDKVLRIEEICPDTYLMVLDNGKEFEISVISFENEYIGFSTLYSYDKLDYKDMTVTDLLAKLNKDSLAKLNIPTSILPTPTPTPTPYVNNPDNPILLGSYKGDTDCGDTYVEAWDNGYLYVKGTGEHDKDWKFEYPADIKAYKKETAVIDTTHIIVEEGITKVSDLFFPNSHGHNGSLPALVYLELPSTVTKVSFTALHETEERPVNDVTIVAYKDGVKTTYILKAGSEDTIEDVLKNYFGLQ